MMASVLLPREEMEIKARQDYSTAHLRIAAARAHAKVLEELKDPSLADASIMPILEAGEEALAAGAHSKAAARFSEVLRQIEALKMLNDTLEKLVGQAKLHDVFGIDLIFG